MLALQTRSMKRLLTWCAAAAFGAVAGQAYMLISRGELPADVMKTWPGARAGFFIAGASAAFELFGMRSAIGLRLRRLPFLASLLGRAAIHTFIIVSVLFLNRLVTAAWVSPRSGEILRSTEIFQDIIHSFVIVVLVLFAIQTHSLIGGQTLLNVVLGRYYRPVREQRLFLMIDVEGSTALARKVGDEVFYKYLSAFFFDVDRPIVDNGGEVHSYVGDALIATWSISDPDRNAAAVRAIFAARERISKRENWYLSEFGHVPRFRAALHAGPIVIGECGDSHRQITYLGDALNTTARLEALSKTLSAEVLASGPVIDCIHLPEEIMAAPLGERTLRGLDKTISVWSLSQRPPAHRTASGNTANRGHQQASGKEPS